MLNLYNKHSKFLKDSRRVDDAGHGLAGTLDLEIRCLRSNGKVIRRVDIYEDWRRPLAGSVSGALRKGRLCLVSDVRLAPSIWSGLICDSLL